MFLRPALISAALVLGTAAAYATPLTGTYSVTVTEGTGPNGGFDTANGNPFTSVGYFSNTASASFTYTGALNFNNQAAQNSGGGGDKNSAFGFSTSNVSNYNAPTASGLFSDFYNTVSYNGSQVADYKTLGSFLTSSGSAANYAYGSYYTFDLGTLVAGTMLTITHDDGVSLFENGVRIGTTSSGPTVATTDTVNILKTGDVSLRYARENGTPSILQVSASVAPEPSSLALLGTGLLGMAGMVRRRLMA